MRISATLRYVLAAVSALSIMLTGCTRDRPFPSVTATTAASPATPAAPPPAQLCGFWPYADWLARTKGVRSVLFSQCGNGASQCPPGDAADRWLSMTTAAVTWAPANGAGQVTLVGASAGGVVAPQVPALFAVAPEDRYVSVSRAAVKPPCRTATNSSVTR